MFKRLVFFIAAAVAVSAASAQPPRLLAGFSTSLYASGLSEPTAMAFAPDGRLFVTQQTGAVRVISADGTLLSDPFTTFAVDSTGERGLLGVAFDPDFASNHYVYFYSTVSSGGISRNRVDRLTANGNTAAAGSAVKILQLPALSSATNHNGGAIHFGPDGRLYVAVGENANGANAQSMETRLGKILRYNADGTIPTDNPFYNSASGPNRAIWALGLRNPYTFDFQPGTGIMFINDVGQSSWEEINQGQAAGNYGWPEVEGAEANPSYLLPVYAYSHSGGNCAITGGSFYNPDTLTYPASYEGDYFFADFCANEVRVRDQGTGDVSIFDSEPPANGIVDLHVGPDGVLYTLARNPGSVYRYDFNAGPVEGELVRNGGFETDVDSDDLPDFWTRSSTSAVQICNSKAIQGSCSVRLTSGSAGSVLRQNISASGLEVGTTVDFSAIITGKNIGSDVSLQLVVTTASGKEKHIMAVPAGAVSALTLTEPTIVLAEAVTKLSIKIAFPAGTTGKLIVDGVSLFASAP